MVLLDCYISWQRFSPVAVIKNEYYGDAVEINVLFFRWLMYDLWRLDLHQRHRMSCILVAP